MKKIKSKISIPFSKPCVDKKELQAVERVLKSGWITTASETLLFEKEFSALLSKNRKKPIYCLAVQSATAGLHLCLKALGIGKGDKVITTPYTFIATASAILYSGAEPIFIDCAPNTLAPSENELEKLKKHVSHKVFLPVHVSGVIQSRTIMQLAKQRGLKIVEDATHCFPAYSHKKKAYLGTEGDMGVYSFYANKTITTGEGGMVVSKNKKAVKHISIMRSHGITRPIWNRYNKDPLAYEYDIAQLGYKYNIPDILSAIGRVQLKKASRFHKGRIKAAQYYLKRLKDVPYIELPTVPKDMEEHSWHLFIIRIKHPKISRNMFMKKLISLGIGTSVHYKPLHTMSYFRKKFNLHPEDFPNALKNYQEVVSLPIYPHITEQELEKVCDAIINITK